MGTKISAADVKKLRDMTGAGMMDCKKALNEAEGDFDKAIELLRKRGQKVAGKKAGRDTTEGAVIAKVSDDHKRGIIVRLSCETDFAAKNEKFINLVNSFADVALKYFPENLEALLQLPTEDGETVAEKVTEGTHVIGENLVLSVYEKLEAEMVAPYIHMGNKAAVLVGLSKHNADFAAAGRDVAMQVAAMKPMALDKDAIDQAVIDKELEIGKDLARQEGKPEAILDKIANGRLNKFFKENTLVNQIFVKDNSKTVAKYLQGVDKELSAVAFKHVTLG